jgi:L-ribulokinase
VRVSLFDSERGRLGFGLADIPVLRSSNDANFVTQRPEDQYRALEQAFAAALEASGVKGRAIEALAVDTTGSTVIPLDEQLLPLDDYYLWCDHRAWREAQEITARAHAQGLKAIDWCGGTYSSEWGFAKALHWLRDNAAKRSRLHTVGENCDVITGVLCGVKRSEELCRSVCAMGHKWMWNHFLGGLPAEKFLASVDPLLAGLRERLQGRYATAGTLAGTLCEQWAHRLNLAPGIPISAGALDAHWDAVGVGCRLGDVVNVIGTSACIMALSEEARPIPGVSGVVDGSIYPDQIGIESGLSAVGDLFESIARRAGATVPALAAKLDGYGAGQTGLLRFAWDNGDRSVLINPRLSGITLGWRLTHTAADELFAAIEGTAFHTRIIMERLKEYGVRIERLIHAGGIPKRNELLNRVYASVLETPILLPEKDTTSLGSAIFAFVVAGIFKSVAEAQAALCPRYRLIEPETKDLPVYEELFGRFRELYFRLGDSAESAIDAVERRVLTDKDI